MYSRYKVMSKEEMKRIIETIEPMSEPERLKYSKSLLGKYYIKGTIYLDTPVDAVKHLLENKEYSYCKNPTLLKWLLRYYYFDGCTFDNKDVFIKYIDKYGTDFAEEANEIMQLAMDFEGTYNNRGITDLDKALYYSKLSIEYYKIFSTYPNFNNNIDNANGFANAYGYLCSVYYHKGDYDNAIKTYEEAKETGFPIFSDTYYKLSLDAKSKKESSKEGCYVATCVYGSYDCPQVWTLRRFRDYKLYKTVLGRTFIKLYYAISPKIIKVLGKYYWFNKICKIPLDKLVSLLYKRGYENSFYKDI